MPFAKEYIIKNNRITNVGGRAIELRGQFGPIDGAMIEGNTCIKTLGIFVRDAKSVLIHHNIIDQNEVYDNTRYGMHLVKCKNITLLGNHLIGVGTHGIFNTDCDDVNISNNILTPGREWGEVLNGLIRADKGQRLIISNNQFQNFNRLSVFTSELKHIIFVNNIITSNLTHNTKFQDALNVVDRDNIMIT